MLIRSHHYANDFSLVSSWKQNMACQDFQESTVFSLGFSCTTLPLFTPLMQASSRLRPCHTPHMYHSLSLSSLTQIFTWLSISSIVFFLACSSLCHQSQVSPPWVFVTSLCFSSSWHITQAKMVLSMIFLHYTPWDWGTCPNFFLFLVFRIESGAC